MTHRRIANPNRCAGPPARGAAERAGARRADDRQPEGRDFAAGVRAGAREDHLRQRARGQQGPAARHRADAYLRAHYRRDAGVAEERVGTAKEMPRPPKQRAGRRAIASGMRRRPRQGKSNDCRHAGESHRRTSGCRDQRHGRGRRERASDDRGVPDDSGGSGPDSGPGPDEIRDAARRAARAPHQRALQAGRTGVSPRRHGGGVSQRREDRRGKGRRHRRAVRD